MDLSKVDIVIQCIMAAVAREDDYASRQLGPIHILKYIYLADLAYAKKHQGETFTGLPWEFYKFGPWSFEAHQQIAPVVKAMGAIEKVYPSKYENDTVRWIFTDQDLLDDLDRKLPGEIIRAVKRSVHEFGSDTYGLLHHVYMTVPMLKAAPKERLDFRTAVPEPVEEPVATEKPMSAEKLSFKEKKRRGEILEDLKTRIRERLENASKSPKMVVPAPPRYDDVYFQGLKWLDDEDGGPLLPSSGEIVFSEDIWKSPHRSDPGVS